MQIIKITDKNFNDVKNITQTTIDSVYPKYYPAGAVQYFKNHHNDENILMPKLLTLNDFLNGFLTEFFK